MTTLDTLRAAGLRIRVDGENLKVRGPLTDELRALALAHKPEIMADLAEEANLIAFHCQGCRFVTPNHPWPSQLHRCIRGGWQEQPQP